MKNKLGFAILLVIMLSAGLAAQVKSESKKGLAWQLGSSLSVAAILHADSNDQGLVDRQFARAVANAGALGIKLSPLPAKTGNKIKDSAAVLRYLLVTTGSPIGKILEEDLGPEHAAIFEIALKSNILLMLYGPGESETTSIATVIRKRRIDSKLPNVMTDPLLALIDRRASYNEVKTELLSLNYFAPMFIAVTEYSENGERFYAQKNYLASAAEFAKAIAVDPTGPEYYFSRGRAYLAQGNNVEAIADYTKVIQLNATSPSAFKNLPVAYHNRGLCYGLIAKKPQAIADLTMAIRLRPNYASAYKIRSMVYRKMGNVRLATADLQTAEKLQPGITK